MELAEFLVRAKKETYAKSEEIEEIILEHGSKEFVYEESGFKYKDKHYGYNPFIGQEIVFKNGKIMR